MKEDSLGVRKRHDLAESSGKSTIRKKLAMAATQLRTPSIFTQLIV